MATMSRYSPPSQPPSGLVDVLNPPAEHRDSAYFSSSSNGEASKHTSVVSCNNPNLFPPSPPGYQSSVTDKTPSPITTTILAQPPLASPSSGGMTVASMVSPTTPSSMDASMLAKLDRPAYDSHRSSMVSIGEMPRRESVESRTINAGFEGMKLAGNSPYASNNQSTTSIQSSLQQQRNPGLGSERLSSSRFPNSYQPNAQRFSDSQKQSRTAPTITGPAASAVANAAEPTKGQPWAFPDEEPDERFREQSRQTSYIGSRRSSLAESLASSQYTTESRLPHGQRRLEDGYGNDFQRLSRASSEFQGASHHHHSLQHKQIGDLQDEEGNSPGSGQPYSRTPELRVSHKLAERKRRNEMKELYDELRDLMPQDRGSKASKWEILSKAIAEHRRQDDAIRSLENRCNSTSLELARSRDAENELRQELRQMRQQLDSFLAHQQGAQPVPAHMGHPVQQVPVESYPPNMYGRGAPQARPESRPEVGLPPIRNLSMPMHPGPESMAGIQYHHETPAGNDYRQAYPPRA